jgi:hypothetical protein
MNKSTHIVFILNIIKPTQLISINDIFNNNIYIAAISQLVNSEYVIVIYISGIIFTIYIKFFQVKHFHGNILKLINQLRI